MALRLPTAPQSAFETVHATLQGFFDRPEGPPVMLAGAVLAQLRVELPHQVFNLGLDDVASGRGLENARATGWRYLLADDSGTLAALEVEPDRAGVYRFSSLNQGPHVGETRRGLDRLRGQAQIEQGSFTLAVLRIPALYVMAFWIRAEDGEEKDLVAPMSPPPLPLKLEIYPAAEFLAALRTPAREKQSRGEVGLWG